MELRSYSLRFIGSWSSTEFTDYHSSTLPQKVFLLMGAVTIFRFHSPCMPVILFSKSLLQTIGWS